MRSIAISVAVAALLIFGALYFSSGPKERIVKNETEQPANNVYMEGEKQIIEVKVVPGGYSPRVSSAKGGIPTVLRFENSGYLSCASAVYLPSMQYRKNVPLKGKVDVEIPSQASGSKFTGLCAMGMYSFEINFN